MYRLVKFGYTFCPDRAENRKFKIRLPNALDLQCLQLIRRIATLKNKHATQRNELTDKLVKLTIDK